MTEIIFQSKNLPSMKEYTPKSSRVKKLPVSQIRKKLTKIFCSKSFPVPFKQSWGLVSDKLPHKNFRYFPVGPSRKKSSSDSSKLLLTEKLAFPEKISGNFFFAPEQGQLSVVESTIFRLFFTFQMAFEMVTALPKNSNSPHTP